MEEYFEKRIQNMIEGHEPAQRDLVREKCIEIIETNGSIDVEVKTILIMLLKGNV